MGVAIKEFSYGSFHFPPYFLLIFDEIFETR